MLQIKRLFSDLAQLYLFFNIIIFTTLVLADNLLFTSPAYDVALFSSFISLLISLPVSMVLIVLSQKMNRNFENILFRVNYPLIMTGLFFFGLKPFSWKLSKEPTYQITLIVVLLLIFTLSVRYLHKESEERMVQLSKLVYLSTLIFLTVGIFYNHMSRIVVKSGSQPSKHLVLFVIDGLPAYLMNTYNPETPRIKLDDLAKDMLVFNRAYTARPSTGKYFGVLYSGDSNPRRSKSSLLEKLQQDGVSTRWVSFRTLGTPDINANNSYDGLRSGFLTEQYKWIPKFLGLNYNLFIYNRLRAPTSDAGIYASYLYNGIHKTQKTEFLVTLMEEMNHLQRNYNRSFLIFHISSTLFKGMGLDQNELWLTDERQRKISSFIRSNGYKYRKDQEWFVKETLQSRKKDMSEVGDLVEKILTKMREMEHFESTTLLISADHGIIYDRGKMFYGYHPDEEVMRVPLMVFNGGKKGDDHRLLNTLDISNSVLDFFDNTNVSHPRALSIFKPNAGQEWIAGLTNRNDQYKEHFFMIHKGHLKYTFNIHSDSSGEAIKEVVTGYKVKKVGSGQTVIDEVSETLDIAMKDFRIYPEDVHSKFHKYLELQYTDQFIVSSVKRFLESNKTINDMAPEIGIRSKTLKEWVSHHNQNH